MQELIMDKKVILAIAAVLVLGVGGYFVATQNKSTAPSGTTTQTSQPQSAGQTLKNLLMGGVAQSCTFSSTVEGSNSQGTVYVSSGKVRGDFSMTSSGKTTMSHMIVDAKTSYLWMDGQKTGFKTTFDTETSSTPSGSTNASGSFDVNSNQNYNCKPWAVDNSMFALPKGIEFMSMESLQQNLNIKTPSY